MTGRRRARRMRLYRGEIWVLAVLAGVVALLARWALAPRGEMQNPPAPAAWTEIQEVSGPVVLEGESRALVSALPAGAPGRGLVAAAAGLVGRVGYFWGGKSDQVGWDIRWGTPALVTAPGGLDTGRLLPYGLDCSGLVSWAAATALGDPAAAETVGQGVRAQYAACAQLDWGAVQPGDLLFFPDLSHVGIAAGMGGDDPVPVIHCSRSLGGVVLSPDARAAGFTLAGRPPLCEG